MPLWSPKTLAVLAAAAFALATPAFAEVPTLNLPDGAPVCRGTDGYAQDFEGRRTFLWRPEWLASLSTRAEKDGAFRKQILSGAEKALSHGPYSVTEKTKPVPGALANDYASIGPYWWPDPKKSDGLPYIRRDGEVNPERNGPEFDKDRLRNLANDVKALALGYYLTSDERFAKHGALLLRTWFVDPATRMNPNFDFAQGIPGKVDGRGEGIIESSDLSAIVEAIGVLGRTDALTAEDHKALREWYRDFVLWMATSPNGESEMRKGNNHGLFYDFYLTHFALYAGASDAARNVVDAFPEYRLARQMDKQGRFVEELKRTRSWHYSVFAVEAAARLATIGECVDRDLWNAELPDGRSLSTARRFLAKYGNDIGSWPFPDRDLVAGRKQSMADKFGTLESLFNRGQVPPEQAEAVVRLP